MNTQEWKSEYQQRAEATQARRRNAGRYARPTAAQDAAYRRLIARNGWNNVTVEDAELLSTHKWLTCSQRAQFALMVAQDKMNRMCAAMVGDDVDNDMDADTEPDDWRKYDYVDHLAGAAYWDEIAVEQTGGI